MSDLASISTICLEYPRLARSAALNLAIDRFCSGTISSAELLAVLHEARHDFPLHDQVLDMVAAVRAVPTRYRSITDQTFSLDADRILPEVMQARACGVDPRTVLFAPVTLLRLSRVVGTDSGGAGVRWVQLDEPVTTFGRDRICMPSSAPASEAFPRTGTVSLASRVDAIFEALNFLSFANRQRYPAAPLLFGVFVALQLAAVYAFVRHVFRATWDQQLASGPMAIAGTCLVCSVMLCFGEHFFHRYILHLETVRFLRALCRGHRRHHKLTSIRFESTESVRSSYPIEDVAHDDQATFPSWALLPFFAFFTPFFAPMAFSFPWVPILIGGYAAIAIAHFLYEVIHVMHHQPHEWWIPRLDQRWFGGVWRRLYGFHQAHHANYKCNLNVAGFFGIPLADLVFGTYRQPEVLLVDGETASSGVARRLTPQPRWPISWLDRVSFKRRRWMVKGD